MNLLIKEIKKFSETDYNDYRPSNVKKTLLSPFFQLIADLFSILITYTAQFLIIYKSDFVRVSTEPDFGAFIFTGIVFSVYWLTLLFFSGMYKNWYIRSPFDEIFSIIKVTFIGMALIVLIVLINTNEAPRYLFMIYYPIFTFVMILNRTIARRLQKALRVRKVIAISSLIIGSADRSKSLLKEIGKCPAWGFKPVGIVATDRCIARDEIDDDRIFLFHCDDGLEQILDNLKPEEVLITTDRADHQELMKIVSTAADRNIIVKIKPDIYNIFTGQTKTLHIYGIPLIEISTQLLKPWQEALKRLIDICFSGAVLVFGLPLWLLVAIIIKIESRGPVFYKQPRVGKNNKVFQIYKYRSMVQDADKQKQKWTSVNDPRVTKFGKFIRKTHLDEIPQFWNVLKGEMSIVGPRPEQPQYVKQFAAEIPYYMRRLKVRPGITGWWQVKYGPHVLDNEEIQNRLKDDFYYIENMSLQLDIEIIIRTVWVVFKGHGQA